MKAYIHIGLSLIAGLFTACESYDFDQEQYKKEINLLQNSEGVYDVQCVKMADEDTDKGAVLQLVVGLSGSQRSDRDYAVNLLRSDSLFHAYNKSQFDIDSTRFAKLLPGECFDEPSLQTSIKAGQSQVLLPFKLHKLDKLSPDSTYFLSYRIDPDSSTPVNHKKKHVLLRVHWENEFASTKKEMAYSYNNTVVIDTQSGQQFRPTNALKAYPLTSNSVRFLAGNEDHGDYKKAAKQIRQKSVVFTIGNKKDTNPLAREITITPYDNTEMEVVMLNPIGENDNTILLNELIAIGGGNSTYYKEFRFHYKYRLLKANNGSPSAFKEVKGKLRYQYNPRADRL